VNTALACAGWKRLNAAAVILRSHAWRSQARGNDTQPASNGHAKHTTDRERDHHCRFERQARHSCGPRPQIADMSLHLIKRSWLSAYRTIGGMTVHLTLLVSAAISTLRAPAPLSVPAAVRTDVVV
jgi:hypothetical protein